MEQALIDRIKAQKYLFRGTNSLDWERRLEEGVYYGTRFQGNYVTCTSMSPRHALIAGSQRCKTACYVGTHPVFIMTNAEPYIGNMAEGLEFLEVEILTPIKLVDITRIETLEQLRPIFEQHSMDIENWTKYWEKEYQPK